MSKQGCKVQRGSDDYIRTVRAAASKPGKYLKVHGEETACHGRGGEGKKVSRDDTCVKAGEERRMYSIAGVSLLPRLNGIAILAGNDFDFRCSDHVVRLHLERRVLHDERPHVVAKAVRVKVTLFVKRDNTE